MANNNENTSFSINANQAFEALEKLQREAIELNQKFKTLKRGTEEYVETAKRIKEVSNNIKDNADKLGLAGMSANQLAYQYRTLKKEISGLIPGTADFIEKNKKLTEIKDRMKLVNSEMGAYGKELGKSTQQTSLFQTALGGAKMGAALLVTALLAVGKAIMDTFAKGVELVAKYSDQFADIRKTTGMTAEEVKKLDGEFAKLNTRTSQTDLLNIAKIGGQIGIAKTEMEGFVKSVDMAVVALGDEFTGGAEEVSKVMGTLKNLFGETKDMNAGEAISRIGSAVNQLGSEGMATGPVMAEFTARMGQLGSLGPNLTDTLGLASVLTGELGLTAEIASGGLTNVLMEMSKNTEAFASFMGMSKAEFEKMFNEDSNKALLKFAEQFKGMTDTQIIATLDALGIKSQEANKVFGGLSNNIDKITKAQASASAAFKENTSLLNEFTIKNETLAAKQEKATKMWQRFVSQQGEKVAPIFAKFLDLLPVGIRILESFSEAFGRIFSSLGKGFASLYRSFERIGEFFGKFGGSVDAIEIAVRAFTMTAELAWRTLVAIIQPLIAMFEIPLAFISEFSKNWEKGFVYALQAGAKGAMDSFVSNATDWGGNFLGIVDTMTFGLLGLEQQFDNLTGRLKNLSNETEKTAGSFLDMFGVNDFGGKQGSLEGLGKGDKKEKKPYVPPDDKTKKDANKKIIDAERILAQERIKAMRDEQARRIAEIEFASQEEIKKFEGTEAQKTEFLKLKEAERQLKIAEVRKEFADKQIEEEIKLRQRLDENKRFAFEKEMQDLTEENDRRLFEKELQEIVEAESLEKLKEENHALYLEKQQEREALEYEQKMLFLEAQLELLREYGYLETEEAKKLLEEKERTEMEFAARQLANEQKTALQKKKIKQEEVKYFAGAAKETAQMLLADEKARSEYGAAVKALALAEIGINLQREIQSIWASEMATKGTILGTIGAVLFTGLAVGRAAAASANVMSYGDGGVFRGASHAQGGIAAIDTASGKKVAEFEGNEPFLILSSNTYQNNKEVVDSLLYASMHQNGKKIFADGGVMGGAAASFVMPSGASAQNNDAILRLMIKIEALLNEISALRATIATNADSFKKSYLLFQDLENAVNEVNAIRNRNGI